MRIIVIIIWLILGFLYWKAWDHQKIHCCTQGVNTEVNKTGNLSGMQESNTTGIVNENQDETAGLLVDTLRDTEIQKSLSQQATGNEEEKTTVIRDITFLFDYNSYEIVRTTEVNRYLDSLSAKFNKADGSFSITGHTDNTGSEQTNMTVGLKRANATKSLLNTVGIPLDKIKTSSEGESNPAADNATPEGRTLNRRAEVKFIKK